jgi:hypothetical protein
LSILLFTVFLLGFIADPIINLYVDPVETIVYKEFWEPSTVSGVLPTETRPSWAEHFVKGLASLGLLSFIKAILALSPWQWWNLRSSGVVSSGRTTGRSRAASISWIVILIGVGSFLWVGQRGESIALDQSLIALYRLSGKVSGLGVARHWRRPANASWMFHCLMTMTKTSHLLPLKDVSHRRRMTEFAWFQHLPERSNAFCNDPRTTLSCHAPVNEVPISQCAENDSDPR